MGRKYDIVLFDLDGTLTDPGEGITNSVAYALEKYGIHVEERSTLYKFIGPPLRDSFRDFYGFSEEQTAEAVKFYREHYSTKGIYENLLYPGIEELLSNLKQQGCKIALATSKPEPFARIILEHFGIAKYFDVIGGAMMDESRTQKEEVIQYVLEQFGEYQADKIIMVGDREYDIMGAKAFSLDSIGVLFGYGDRRELENAGATYIAENVTEIQDYLQNTIGN